MRVWCGIVICGGIGTEGSGNYELSGVGVCTRGYNGVVLGVGGEILAGDYINGVEVGA